MFRQSKRLKLDLYTSRLSVWSWWICCMWITTLHWFWFQVFATKNKWSKWESPRCIIRNSFTSRQRIVGECLGHVKNEKVYWWQPHTKQKSTCHHNAFQISWGKTAGIWFGFSVRKTSKLNSNRFKNAVTDNARISNLDFFFLPHKIQKTEPGHFGDNRCPKTPAVAGTIYA